MARIRTIKPEFFLDEDLATLDPLDRLTFAGLFCQADKAGRMEDRPDRLRLQVLPYDEGDFNARLTRLHETRFIIRYEVSGKRYIQIRTFGKHQRPHHTERDSTLPSVNGDLTVREPLRDGELPVGKGKGKGSNTLAHPTDERTRQTTRKTTGTPAGFDVWWNEYPKKVGKIQAIKEWGKLHPDASLHAVLLEALRRQKGTVKAMVEHDRQHILDPERWLKYRRWEDEVAAEPAAPQYPRL